MRGAPFGPGGHLDRDDQVAATQRVVALRRVGGEAMEIVERDRSLSRSPTHDYDGVERCQRHSEVGGVGRDTIVGPAEDRVVAIDAVQGRAAGARPALVARQVVLVAEIGAARALHHVAADRGHVAELAGGRG